MAPNSGRQIILEFGPVPKNGITIGKVSTVLKYAACNSKIKGQLTLLVTTAATAAVIET